MTDKEKAQAYDEALNKAKIEIDTKGIGETVNLCYQLFPQLAENDDEESDDERIRKRLIEYFEGFRMGNAEVRWEGLIVQEVLAWLKKQKECVADNSKTSTDEDERIINQLITLVNSAGEVLLIPTNKEELVAWLNKYKESLHIPETCKENADSFTEDERIRQWLYNLVDEGAYLCERPFATESILSYLEKQKEQKYYWKPTETDVALFNKAVTTNNTLTPVERANLDIIRSKFGCCRATNCSGIVQKEQKPAEWSDTNELVFKDICKHLKEEGYNGWIVLLNALRNGEFQQKQEWSEEDEKILNELLDYCNTENATWYNWLKSLRPQSKAELTLLDENIIDAAIAFVEQNNHFSFWGGIDKHTVIKALRSLKSKWKPTDEQMEALKNSAYGSYQNGDGPILRELYEQLKKLI